MNIYVTAMVIIKYRILAPSLSPRHWNLHVIISCICLRYLIQKLSDPKHEMLKCFHTILNIRPLKCQVII